MKTDKLFALILSVLIIQGCAANKDKTMVAPEASLYQTIDTDGVVVSPKKHIVTVSYYTEWDFIKNKTIFKISVENRGNHPFKINNDNITVRFEGYDKGLLKKIPIQSLSEFMKDFERDFQNHEKENIREILEKTEFTARIMGDSPSPEDVASMFAMKFINTVNKIELKHEQYDNFANLIQDLVLKEQTITPGSSIDALAPCDTSGIAPGTEGNFTVTVSIDGETHSFIFKRSLAK